MYWFGDDYNQADSGISTQLDVINLISKTPGLPDAPVTAPDQFEQNAIPMFTNGSVPAGYN